MKVDNRGSVAALAERAARDISAAGARVPESSFPSVGAAPVVALTDAIIREAVEMNASDIHIEPMKDRLRVRYRIDGMLREMHGKLPLKLKDVLLSRLKIMAKLDTTERRLPQDGRIAFEAGKGTVDIRISTMPVILGETAVLRLLSGSRRLLHLDELGFTPENRRMFEDWCRRPSGLILNCGPVNSGKTTTLYAALNELNTAEKNIVTIEDPVEYFLPGVNQIQVGSETKMTFARGVRSLMRQDFDVGMVGEIRDEETAEIAVRAAMTGRLLFSTLHTGSAAGAVFRMLDMGVKPYLLAASLLGIMAQRLVRRLCPECREEYEADEDEARFLAMHGHASRRLFRSKGCEKCRGTGYSGRMALHELLTVSPAVQRAVAGERCDMERLAKEAGMVTLAEDGIKKAAEGRTSLAEVRRVVYGGL
ncbi:MAG: type II/IV secretion system protein [Schwartzia sp.]|nr:type II/IV secretion system protein [Schwartzia sp. (in: firmicutes)]